MLYNETEAGNILRKSKHRIQPSAVPDTIHDAINISATLQGDRETITLLNGHPNDSTIRLINIV